MIDGFDDAVIRHPSGQEAAAPTRRRHAGRWLLVGAVIALVALLTSLFAFGLSRDPTIVRSVLVGRPAPPFELRTIDGSRSVRLADFRDQVVVVNFWASWCRDCLVEHPSLAAAWERYRDQGVILLGVEWNDRPSDSLSFASKLRMDWPLLFDPGSRTAIAYGVYGAPETFVIGRGGQIAYKQIGPVPYDVLTDQITRLLPGSAG